MWSSSELCSNSTLKLAWFEIWRRTLFATSTFCIYLFLQIYCLRLTSQYYVYSSTIHDKQHNAFCFLFVTMFVHQTCWITTNSKIKTSKNNKIFENNLSNSVKFIDQKRRVISKFSNQICRATTCLSNKNVE